MVKFPIFPCLTLFSCSCGMTQEEIAKLFQPFVQIQAGSRQKGGGTGLGLYISRKICESLGGTLIAESDGPAKGSRFAMRVPVRIFVPVIPSDVYTTELLLKLATRLEAQRLTYGTPSASNLMYFAKCGVGCPPPPSFRWAIDMARASDALWGLRKSTAPVMDTSATANGDSMDSSRLSTSARAQRDGERAAGACCDDRTASATCPTPEPSAGPQSSSSPSATGGSSAIGTTSAGQLTSDEKLKLQLHHNMLSGQLTTFKIDDDGTPRHQQPFVAPPVPATAGGRDTSSIDVTDAGAAGTGISCGSSSSAIGASFPSTQYADALQTYAAEAPPHDKGRVTTLLETAAAGLSAATGAVVAPAVAAATGALQKVSSRLPPPAVSAVKTIAQTLPTPPVAASSARGSIDISGVSADTATANKDSSNSATTASSSGETSTDKLRFLVVDDVASNRLMLKRMVARLFPGCAIAEAEDGAQAIKKVIDSSLRDGGLQGPLTGVTERSPFDVILLDGSMPVLDGYQCARRLRSGEIGYQGLIIGVTGNALSDDQSEFIAAGADCVHVKPVSSAALAADIRRRLALTG